MANIYRYPERYRDEERGGAFWDKVMGLLPENLLPNPKIEMLWIEKAADLGIQALMVGMLLHFRSVWCGKDSVTLPKELLDKFHISRGVKQRALRSLEEAGLVSISQETGRSPVVTLRKV